VSSQLNLKKARKLLRSNWQAIGAPSFPSFRHNPGRQTLFSFETLGVVVVADKPSQSPHHLINRAIKDAVRSAAADVQKGD
jgi:hypothetical protein